jgi:hypothetical protein
MSGLGFAASVAVLFALASIASDSPQGSQLAAAPDKTARWIPEQETSLPTQVPESRTLGFVTIRQATVQGFMSYLDSEDGFQLEYPSNVECEQQLIFRDPPSPTMIALNLVLSSEDPKTYVEVLRSLHGSFDREKLNGVTWIVYRTSSGAIGYYIYHDHMAIDIEGVPSVATNKISDDELRAIREMASTLQFTKLSERMDYRISALKVGDRFGKLTVQKVITRAAANRNRRNYWANPLGEVDFAGTVRLTGVLDNNQTMNSGPDYVISAFDSASYSQVPQIGHPFDFAQDDSFQIHLTNADYVADAIGKRPNNGAATDSPVTIVVDHLNEVFYPGGGAPLVTANLLRVE